MARTKSVNELKREFHEVATERFQDIENKCSAALSLLLEAEDHIQLLEDDSWFTLHCGFMQLTKALLAAKEGTKLSTYWNLKPSKKESPDA